jgi:type VI secretion system secreted protein Hcp
MQMCASGDHFDTAQLTIRKSGGKNPLEYAIYTFKQVYVDSVQHNGVAGSSDELMETLGLSYGEVHLKYTPQKPDGTGDSPVEGGWDLTTNTAS